MIQVKFFSSLRELVGGESQQLASKNALTVRDVWQQSTNCEMPSNTLCAINMEYVKLDDEVNDEDEVAFFPPVTGG